MKLQIINRSLDKLKASAMYIGIITIITVVVWVGVSVYTSFSKTTIDPDIQTIIKPINPNLNDQVLQTYSASRVRPPEQFRIISIVQEGDQITEKILDPYEIVKPSASASPSAQTLPEPTPEPTPNE